MLLDIYKIEYNDYIVLILYIMCLRTLSTVQSEIVILYNTWLRCLFL